MVQAGFIEMPERQRVCPVCWLQAGSTDSYCSSCGSVLPQNDVTSATVHSTIEGDIAPLTFSRPYQPNDLQPLTIIPDNWRQRRRMLRHGFALLLTLAMTCAFALSVVLLVDRSGDASVMALAATSGLLTIVAMGGWIAFGVKRARKRTRRQQWHMSTS